MKHPVEDTSHFGIDLIDKLVKEYMQENTGSTKFFQVVGNTNILDCLGSVFEEPDHDEPWGVHDAKVTTTLAHLEHDSKTKEDWKQTGIKAKTELANQHEEQSEVGIMPTTQVTDSNQVGQTVSRPIGEVSPPKPPIELKPLLDHLKYAYLGDEQQFPIIIVSNLHQEQEEKLLQVLKQHKKAIGWKLSDLLAINPSIYMHRTLMEEEARPVRQQQRRLNPTILDVVKKEVTKLLVVGIIYPISDSSWVSPVQVVPKKSGMTTMKN
ncbi:hypothetical protein CR513_05111, partial [Mucuna pruriens]